MSGIYAFSYVRDKTGDIGWDVQISASPESFPGIVVAFCHFALGCGFDPQTISEYIPDWQNIDLA